MSSVSNHDLTRYFAKFYQEQCKEKVGILAQKYPTEQKSLYVDYDDLYQFDRDLAEDYIAQPEQISMYAEEALRLFDLPGDVKLANAHVRLQGLPSTVESIGPHQSGRLVAVEGIITEAGDEDFEIVDAALECKRCGTMNFVPQQRGEYQEPHECQGCERKGPFGVNFDQSEFVDTQRFTLRSTNSDLSDGSKPLEINFRLEDDLVGVAAGEYVTVTGIVIFEQKNTDKRSFEPYLKGVSVVSSDDPSPRFDSPADNGMGMEEYLNVASDVIVDLPETALEPGTKAKLITPFIEALGWNKFDNNEWRFEYTDSKTEKRVDYALFAGNSESPDVVVEAKRLGKGLHEGEPQIYDYLRVFSAEYGLVSNGKSYRVYRNYPEKKPERVAEIELHDIPNAGILDEIRPSAFKRRSSTGGGGELSDPSDNIDESEGDQAAEDISESDGDIDPKDRILNVINLLESDHENGVPLESAVEHITDRGMEESEVTKLIDSLAMKGSIYYISKNQIKTT